jgi:hypothetical protein
MQEIEHIKQVDETKQERKGFLNHLYQTNTNL